jgi:hypothetical protein
VASEARIYYNLLFVFGLCEFDKEDLGGEVVDIRDAESDESVGKLMRNYLEMLVW